MNPADMEPCEFKNHTFIVPSIDPIIGVEGNNVLTGKLGSCMDGLLCPIRRRACQIIGQLDLGTRLENGSYTNILGTLQRKEADMYLKAESEFINEPWLLRTQVPIHTEKVMLTHLLIQKNQRYFDLMSNFEFGIELFVFYFGALFLVLLTLSVLIRQHRRIRQDKREPAQTSSFLNYFRWSVNCFFIDQYSFSSVGLFLTFTQLYFWLIQLFLANNIKTNKVVVDTKELITDRQDIFSTSKVACFLNHETELYIASDEHLPKNSFMHKLFEKSQLRPDMVEEAKVLRKDRCLIERDSSMIPLLNSQNLFLLVIEQLSYLAYSLFTMFKVSSGVTRAWILRSGIYEFNTVLFGTLRHPTNKQLMEKFPIRYTEAGLAVRMYTCMKRNSFLQPNQEALLLYYNLQEVHADFTGFSDLVLSNFQSLLSGYFVLCLIIFTAYLLDLCIRFLKLAAQLS